MPKTVRMLIEELIYINTINDPTILKIVIQVENYEI